MSIEIRPARTSDVKQIRSIIDTYAAPGRMLEKETVTLFESVQEFIVAVDGETVVGCAALHILWEDLAEVRTVAVVERLHKSGIGHRLLDAIVSRAKVLGVKRIFCLTFQTEFFGKHGFEVPLLKWLRTDLWELLDKDLLTEDFIESQGIFEMKKINQLKRQLFSASPGDIHAKMWALLVFQYWWKKYFI